MFYLIWTYVGFKSFMLQVLRISEVCLESNGGTTQAPGEEVPQVGCRRTKHATRIGSYRQGVLVLILTHGSHPRGEREDGVKEGAARAGYVCRVG